MSEPRKNERCSEDDEDLERGDLKYPVEFGGFKIAKGPTQNTFDPGRPRYRTLRVDDIQIHIIDKKTRNKTRLF